MFVQLVRGTELENKSLQERQPFFFFFAGLFFKWDFQLKEDRAVKRRAGKGEQQTAPDGSSRGGRIQLRLPGRQGSISMVCRDFPPVPKWGTQLYILTASPCPWGNRGTYEAVPFKPNTPFLARKGPYLSYSWVEKQEWDFSLTYNSFSLEVILHLPWWIMLWSSNFWTSLIAVSRSEASLWSISQSISSLATKQLGYVLRWCRRSLMTFSSCSRSLWVKKHPMNPVLKEPLLPAKLGKELSQCAQAWLTLQLLDTRGKEPSTHAGNPPKLIGTISNPTLGKTGFLSGGKDKKTTNSRAYEAR